MAATKFLGGSPVSDATNPYGKGAVLGAEDILPSLDIEGREREIIGDLDAYGSSPVTGDAAAQRPLAPDTIAGIDANE